MTIQVGDKLPEAKFRVMTAEGPQVKTTDDLFKGKKVACSRCPAPLPPPAARHLPGTSHTADLQEEGREHIVSPSVNDAFVMNAWSANRRATKSMVADGNAEFTKKMGLEMDGSKLAWASRQRYAMLVDNGVIKKLNLEPAPGKVEVSGGDTLLGQL